MLLDAATQRCLEKFRASTRDMTDNGHKKEARVENSKTAKCKIAGDAYRMSCDDVIIIVAPTVTIIVHWIMSFFLYFP